MCEIAEALEKEGIEKGREESIEKGIVAMIEGCNELGIAKKDAYNKIKNKFSLNDGEIDMYFKQYWK